MIDRNFVVISWSENDLSEAIDMKIWDVRDPVDDSAHYENTVGACGIDWMKPGADPRETPEGVYGHMIAIGFDSPEAHMNILHMFSLIDGCDWALAILDGFSASATNGVANDNYAA